MTSSEPIPSVETMDSSENLNLFAQWAISLMEALGSVGAGVAVAAENIFPPIPSEIILPLAGFTASRGTFALWEVLVWTTLGSLVGAVALYGLGAWLGADRLRRIVARVPLMKVSDVDRAEEWFGRHGEKAVFFGRMIPIVRAGSGTCWPVGTVPRAPIGSIGSSMPRTPGSRGSARSISTWRRRGRTSSSKSIDSAIVLQRSRWWTQRHCHTCVRTSAREL